MKKTVKKQKPRKGSEVVVAATRVCRATVPELKDAIASGEIASVTSTAARRSTATDESGTRRDSRPYPDKLTKSEAGLERWRKIRAGLLPHPDKSPRGPGNPLFQLPEEERAKLFVWLRECPYDDAVRQMLRDHGQPEVTAIELSEFFQVEAEQHWEKRISRAAQEANALVKLVEKSPARFSSGILAALGQEAFRQIASGQVEPDAMGKLATLFLKARSDERADQMQVLKREKLRRDLQGQIDQALERLAEDIERHPSAKEAFEKLREELAHAIKIGEDES